MSETTPTVIIATIGRVTLARTLTSLRGQPPDEVLLVADGPAAAEAARPAWTSAGLPGRFVELADGPHGDWGHTPRNLTMPLVRTTHMMHMDDDDVYVADAIDAVRKAIDAHPHQPILFRMILPDGRVIWEEPELRLGGVSTQSIVHPVAHYGTWTNRYGGDFDFIQETCTMYPAGPVFDPRIIARYRHGFPEVMPVGERRPERGKRPGSLVSVATINKELRHLRAALSTAKEWGYLPKVPKFRMIREPKYLPTYVTGDDFAAIYKACDKARMPEDIPNVSPADWWRAARHGLHDRLAHQRHTRPAPR
jgi:hypothetical protein